MRYCSTGINVLFAVFVRGLLTVFHACDSYSHCRMIGPSPRLLMNERVVATTALPESGLAFGSFKGPDLQILNSFRNKCLMLKLCELKLVKLPMRCPTPVSRTCLELSFKEIQFFSLKAETTTSCKVMNSESCEKYVCGRGQYHKPVRDVNRIVLYQKPVFISSCFIYIRCKM